MSKKLSISPALLQELGTMSDFKLAAKYRKRPCEIKQLRLERGIPAVHEHIEVQHFTWTAETEALLGTMPDTLLAAKLNTTKSIVNTHRNQLKIPAYELPALSTGNYSIEMHQWSDWEDALLGSDFDSVIAERLGLNSLQVNYRRNQLGVEAFRNSKPIEWTGDMLRNLGEISDKDFAEYFEISPTSVYIKRILLEIPAFGHIDPPSPPFIPKEAFALLGQLTDSELSEKFSLNRLNFRIHRMILGIPSAKRRKPNVNHFQWTAQLDALLGTMSDCALARKLNTSKNTVRYRRRKLNIPTYQCSKEVDWDELKLAQLGRSTDKTLAQMWHCEVSTIKMKREELAIAEHHGPRHWSEDEIALLGTLSDPELGKRIGISATAVANKRKMLGIKAKLSSKPQKWTQHYLKLLGTEPDASIAYRMKVHPSTVSKKRTELGIPAFVSEHKGIWLNPANRALLGQIPDKELAKKLGITPPAIVYKRKQMGIPAFKGYA